VAEIYLATANDLKYAPKMVRKPLGAAPCATVGRTLGCRARQNRKLDRFEHF
jgi:hypothetical protein